MKKFLLIALPILLIATGAYVFLRWSNLGISGTGRNSTSSGFFPAGSRRDITTGTSDTAGENNAQGSDDPTSRQNASFGQLRQITDTPVAGAYAALSQTAGSKKATSSNLVWYIEKTTGHILAYDPEAGAATLRSGTTIPNSYEAYWGETANQPRFIIRHGKEGAIENLFGKLAAASGTADIYQTAFRPLNASISRLAVAPARDRYFYLVDAPNGSLGYIGSFTESKDVESFVSPYPRWNIAWPEASTLLFVTAPRSDEAGYAYSYSLKTKDFLKIVGGEKGLSASMSPNGQKVIYSSADGRFALHLKDMKKSGPDILLGISTLPEKCVWTKNSQKFYCAVPAEGLKNNEPDAWYQGRHSFSDSLWEIDAASGGIRQIFNPEQAGMKGGIDAVNLLLTAQENRLILTNKKDYSLWILDLTPAFVTPTATSTN